ncbi:hypothetical protein M199_gp183 [Halogranum tailed virus 1]|uniref:Uncharacterized protein n=1 Tax=Halogranum tailed virus 1 TaxID=1273749 RepID=R4TMS5_9CAUD|nr:hypothetical protein M199_gp183 [Halogranum tailed virus 1]AGM11483.1 hypothetical protein HGTV1_186 [Halogranum tailed virus 1]
MITYSTIGRMLRNLLKVLIGLPVVGTLIGVQLFVGKLKAVGAKI